MINIDLKFKNGMNAVSIQDEILFNALLSQKPDFIKKLIKSISPLYRIKKDFYEIVNPFVDIDKNGCSLYAGLIIRTDFAKFAILYLEKTEVDEDYMISLVTDYLHDRGEDIMKKVELVKFEIDKKSFMKAL